MSEYAYTQAPGKVPELFGKIKSVGIPTKANREWLDSIGLKSSNDRTLLRVLKQIDFINQSNAPTDRWKSYRGQNSKQVLGAAVREGYEGLFEVYPDANSRSESELRDFFSTKTDGGKAVIDKTTKTFRSLCELADFDGAPAGTPPPARDEVPDGEQNGEGGGRGPQLPNVGINVNVQLVLPDGADAESYDALFAAMRKHLFPEGG